MDEATVINVASTETQPAASSRDTVLAWKNIQYFIDRRISHRKVEEVELLHGIGGVCRSAEMMAVVGPSGAGKSTLLDILSFHKTVGRVSGRVHVNGKPMTISSMQKVSSYVAQDEAFHPTQTVLESVMFQAQMRLGSSVPYEHKLKLALDLIEKAGLQGKEKTKIGGLLPGGINLRGISGGEQRRLAVCCGIITQPSILFADEPTSGLDSLAALMISNLLRNYANSGMVVVCTIHQPRQDIWNLFDHISVLSKGYQLYQGPPKECTAWFTTVLGIACPLESSPSDWILDHINIDFDRTKLAGSFLLSTVHDIEKLARFFESQHLDVGTSLQGDIITEKRLSPYTYLNKAMNTSVEESKTNEGDDAEAEGLSAGAHLSWGRQFTLLLLRNGRAYIRNWGNVLARFVVIVFVGATTAAMYGNLGRKGPRAFNDVMTGIYNSIFFVTLLPYASQSGFLHDRRFFQRENAAGLYYPSAYYAANVLLELILNATGGLVYGVIMYLGVNFQGIVRAANPVASGLGYAGLVALMNVIANAQIMCVTLASPNLEFAFIMAAGYTTISTMGGGLQLMYTNMNPSLLWVQWLSMIKYPFQASVLRFFQNNPKAITPFGMEAETLIHKLRLDNPPTVLENVIISFVLYFVFIAGGFLALKYMYKAQR